MTGRLTIREDAPSGMAWTVIYGFLARVGVVVSAVGLTAALLTVWRFGDQYRPGFLPIAVLLLIVGVVWSWWDVARGRPGQNGLKFYVVAATVLFALHPWMWTGDPVNGYPTLFHGLVIALGLAALAFTWPVATGVALVYLVTFAYMRYPAIGFTRTLLDSGTLAVAALAAIVSKHLIASAYREVERTAEQAKNARETTHRTEARAKASAHWDDIVHSYIIGSLLVTARCANDEASEAGRSLASKAVNEFQRISGSDSDLIKAIEDVAKRYQLDVATDFRGEVPAEAASAIQASVTEALTNVHRHSGQSSAEVIGTFAEGSAQVVVRDCGRGFDPTAVAPERAGIRRGIRDAMTSINGTATIQSTVGEGTRVTLSYSRPVQGPAQGRWTQERFLPLTALVAASLALHVVMGISELSRTRSLTVASAAMAILTVQTVTALFVRHRPAIWALVMSIVVLTAVSAANLTDPRVADWRYWFAGGITGSCAILSFRFSLRPALVAVLGSYVAVGAVLAALHALLPTILGVFAVYSAPCAASLLARISSTFNVATATLAAEHGKLLEARMALLESQATLEEWEDRQSYLRRRILPMLRTIVEADQLTHAQRHECELLEKACRDQIWARRIITPALEEQILLARRRGVRVELRDEDGTVPPSVTILLQWAAATLLDVLDEDDMLTMIWSDDVATLFVRGGPGTGAMFERPLCEALASLACAGTVDAADQTLLAEFRSIRANNA